MSAWKRLYNYEREMLKYCICVFLVHESRLESTLPMLPFRVPADTDGKKKHNVTITTLPMCNVFYVYSPDGLAAFRGPILFPLYPLIARLIAAFTSESTRSPKIDFGVGLTQSSST